MATGGFEREGLDLVKHEPSSTRSLVEHVLVHDAAEEHELLRHRFTEPRFVFAGFLVLLKQVPS